RSTTPRRMPTSVPPGSCARTFARRSRQARGHNAESMPVTFAKKLERVPDYEAGLAIDAARERYGAADVAKLASNESPWGPHPAVVEAIARAASGANRYPEQFSPTLRRRIAERHDIDRSRVAIGNGSCELLLAACEALCEPGAEIVFAWPSFSMYPHLAALSGAREVRVPLAEGDVHNLDAMLAEISVATQLVVVCNPNNPTSTHVPAAEIAAFCDRLPRHAIVVLDEAGVVRGLGERGVIVRAGSGLGGPGHIRVTYGTRAENERFVAALSDVLQ